MNISRNMFSFCSQRPADPHRTLHKVLHATAVRHLLRDVRKKVVRPSGAYGYLLSQYETHFFIFYINLNVLNSNDPRKQLGQTLKHFHFNLAFTQKSKQNYKDFFSSVYKSLDDMFYYLCSRKNALELISLNLQQMVQKWI